MSERNSRSQLIARRGELLAELFLQDLEPTFVSKSGDQDVGYDFFIGFTNGDGGINTFAVALRATERPVPLQFRVDRRSYRRLTHSNIPVLLLVADVKQNQLYCAWLGGGAKAAANGNYVSVPLVEVDEAVKRRLHEQVKSSRAHGAAVAG